MAEYTSTNIDDSANAKESEMDPAEEEAMSASPKTNKSKDKDVFVLRTSSKQLICIIVAIFVMYLVVGVVCVALIAQQRTKVIREGSEITDSNDKPYSAQKGSPLLKRDFEKFIQTIVEDVKRMNDKIRNETTNEMHDLNMDIKHSINSVKQSKDATETGMVDKWNYVASTVQNLTDIINDAVHNSSAFHKEIAQNLGRIRESIHNDGDETHFELQTMRRTITSLEDRLNETFNVLRSTSLKLQAGQYDLLEKVDAIKNFTSYMKMLWNSHQLALTMSTGNNDVFSISKRDPTTAPDFSQIFLFWDETTEETTDAEDEETTTTASSIRVRLRGGGRTYGRVEIFRQGAWGTICDDGWDTNDGTVVCKMLGFRRATSAPHSAAYGEGSENIILDNVACTGRESSIDQCSHRTWGYHDCTHSEDASVVCI